jgi:hypothetical protein
MVFKKNKPDSIIPDFFCSTCGAKVSSGGLFCRECAPPILPIDEPEETGISFEQALKRIFILILLFLSIAVIKLDLSISSLFLNNTKSDYSGSLIESKKKSNEAFDVMHTVIPHTANVRSKPSIKSEIIGMVKQGMNLVVIESNESWSKVHVFEKTGWIASRLIKAEVQAKH